MSWRVAGGISLPGGYSRCVYSGEVACIISKVATVGLLVSESHDLAAVSWIYIHLRPCGGHVWPGSSIYMSLPPPDSSSFESFSFRAIAFFHFESIHILAKYSFI